MWTCPQLQDHQDFRFRVGIHDLSSEFRLQVEGSLGATESREVESCWRTAASTIGGRRFTVDLSMVRSIDPPAAELLSRMRDSGAELQWGPLNRALASVGFHEGLSTQDAKPDDSSRSSRFATRLVCLLLRLRRSIFGASGLPR